MSSELEGGADAFSYEGDDLAVLAASHNYNAWIVDLVAPYVAGHVIEYGAGSGTISAKLLGYAQRLDLVEPEARLVTQLRQRFDALPQVTIFTDMLERHVASSRSDSFDTIVMINVLEHIENDRAAVAELVRTLRRNGRLIIFVPALPWLMSDLDRAHGHFRRYVRRDLLEIANGAHCAIEKLHYFDVAGIIPWWLVNRVGKRVTFDARSVALYDRVAVPIMRRVEAAIAPPIGKNLILVARKL